MIELEDALHGFENQLNPLDMSEKESKLLKVASMEQQIQRNKGDLYFLDEVHLDHENTCLDNYSSSYD